MISNGIAACAAALIMTVLAAPVGILTLQIMGMWQPDRKLLLVAVLVGLLVFPLVINLIVGLTSVPLAVTSVLVIWIGLILSLYFIRRLTLHLVPRDHWSEHTFKGYGWALLGVGTVLGVLTLMPLLIHNVPIGNLGVYRTNVTDWAKHISITTAIISSQKLPPPNPFLIADSRLHYYYLSYVLPAFTVEVSGEQISAANSLMGLVLIQSFCIPYLIFVYAVELGTAFGLSKRGAFWASVFANLLCGLDGLLILLTRFFTGNWPGDTHFWEIINNRELTSINYGLIWTPQHIMGLIAFILLQTLYYSLLTTYSRNKQVLLTIASATLLASMQGSSAFVWLVTLAAVGLMSLVELLLKHFKNALLLICSVILSVLLSIPMLILVSQRTQIPISIFISSAGQLGPFNALLGSGQVANFFDFFVQLLISYGFLIIVGVAGILKLSQQAKNNVQIRLWMTSAFTILIFLLAIRDNATINNYAPRISPMLCVVLAVPGAYWWIQRTQSRSWRHYRLIQITLYGMLIVSLLTSFYEPIIYLLNPALIPSSEVELYQWLNTHLGRNDIYQIGLLIDGNAPYFVSHRTALADDGLHVAMLYASSLQLYEETYADIQAGYNTPKAQEASRLFSQLNISYVVTSNVPEQAIHLNSIADTDFAQYFEMTFNNGDFVVYHIHNIF